ncbi:MAG: nucleotidyltransferase family protein [Roseburia sp.]
MQEIGIKEQVLEEICELARLHQIEKVILFGSRARGTFQKTSDIDLAVSGGDKILFSLDVEEKTSTLLTYDIVDLDAAIQENLRRAIEKEGILLYEKI